LSHQHFPKLQEKLVTIRGVPLITAGVTSGRHKGGQSIILEEAQYDNIKGWIERQRLCQPTVSLQATLVPSDYTHFGHIFLNPSRTCKVKAVTNTGCESTLIGIDAVHQMGYKKSDLIQTDEDAGNRHKQHRHSWCNDPLTIWHGAGWLTVHHNTSLLCITNSERHLPARTCM
jgi:hypothetical protein